MRLRSAISGIVAAFLPICAHAQFYSYPSFQPPRVSVRDFNFAAAVAGDAGTSLIFQWRESVGTYSHLQLDAGFADPKAGVSSRLVIGGSIGYQPLDPSTDFPLDLLVTGGIGGSFAGGLSLIRIPVGVSVGKRFVVSGPVALTPYVHPRLTVGRCSECGALGHGDTSLGVDLDVGAGIELTKMLELRASASFAGSHTFGRDDSFGLSLVWRPGEIK